MMCSLNLVGQKCKMELTFCLSRYMILDVAKKLIRKLLEQLLDQLPVLDQFRGSYS